MGISADVEGDAVEPIHTTDEVEDEIFLKTEPANAAKDHEESRYEAS